MAIRTTFKFISKFLKTNEKASFILHSVEEDDLDEFRKESAGFVSGILLINDKKPRKMKEKEYFLSTIDWEKDEQELMEKTRGAFIFHENFNESESEFISRMENYRKYYPLIFISPESDSEIYSSHLSGWKEHASKHGVIIFVNKGKKEFEDYIVNFKKILSKEPEIKPVISVRMVKDDNGRDLVEEVFDTGKKKSNKERPPSPITWKKPTDEANWSIFDNLPQPSMSPDPSNPTWIKEFYIYLRELVQRITPPGKEKLIDIIVNKDTIKDVWLDVFTSGFVNLNPGENYEAYEAVGDSVLKYVFYIYLYDRYAPNINQNQLNDLKTKFLSKGWQSIAGEKMGLHEWVLIPEVLRNHPATKEDMQESFCGGLEIILNKVIPNQGYSKTMLLYMFQKLFRDYEVDLTIKLTPKETQVEQWFAGIAHGKREEKVVIKKPQSVDRGEWKAVTKDFSQVLKKHGILMGISETPGKNELGVRYEEDVKSNGSAIYRVYLDESGYTTLERMGINLSSLKNKLLSEVKSSTLSQAKTNARIKAMEKLEELGVTQDWVNRHRKAKKNKDIQGIDEALIKARHEHKNIVEIYPDQTKEILKDKVFQLIGVTKDGKKINLETMIVFAGGNSNPTNAFQDLVNKYLASSSSDEDEKYEK